MNERSTIEEYHDIVIEFHSIRQRIAWNIRHGLPVITLAGQGEQLKRELLRFEDLINRIQDRQARNAIRCRYALGMNLAYTAELMDISKVNVIRLTARGMNDIEQPAAEHTDNAPDHDGVQTSMPII